MTIATIIMVVVARAPMTKIAILSPSPNPIRHGILCKLRVRVICVKQRHTWFGELFAQIQSIDAKNEFNVSGISLAT